VSIIFVEALSTITYRTEESKHQQREQLFSSFFSSFCESLLFPAFDACFDIIRKRSFLKKATTNDVTTNTIPLQ